MFVRIDYPQVNHIKSNECSYYEESYFLNTNKTIQLVFGIYLNEKFDMKIYLKDIDAESYILLNTPILRHLIFKLKNLYCINIRHPFTINNINDNVKISLIRRKHRNSNNNCLVLDAESIHKLISMTERIKHTLSRMHCKLCLFNN